MISGKVWKYGQNVNTDAIYPAKYLVHFEPEEVVRHVMEGLDPEFIAKAKPGDIIVAGDNFGCGSAREQAAMAIKLAQIGAVVADSFNRTFYRNAINNALPVIALKGISKEIAEGDEIEIDMETGKIIDHTIGKQWSAVPTPGFILDILNMGGAIAYYRGKIGH